MAPEFAEGTSRVYDAAHARTRSGRARAET